MISGKYFLTPFLVASLLIPRVALSDDNTAPVEPELIVAGSALAPEAPNLPENDENAEEDILVLSNNTNTSEAPGENRTKPYWIFIVGGIIAALILANRAGSSSESQSDPAPCTDCGDLPLPPNIVVVVNPSTYVGANDTESGQEAIGAIKERDFSSPRRGLFSSVGITDTELNETDSTRAGESQTTSLLVGYDQFYNDKTLLGAMIDISRGNSSINTLKDSADTDSLSLFLFSSFQLRHSFEFSAYIGFGTQDKKSIRTSGSSQLSFSNQFGFPEQTTNVIDGDVFGRNSGSTYSYGVSVAKSIDLNHGTQINLNGDIDYSRRNTDSYSETGETFGELAYNSHVDKTIRFRFGAKLSKVFSQNFGVIVPSIGADVIFNEQDKKNNKATLTSNPDLTTEIAAAPTEDFYGSLNTEIMLIRPRGLQFFSNLKATLGHEFEQSISGNIGMRLEF